MNTIKIIWIDALLSKTWFYLPVDALTTLTLHSLFYLKFGNSINPTAILSWRYFVLVFPLCYYMGVHPWKVITTDTQKLLAFMDSYLRCTIGVFWPKITTNKELGRWISHTLGRTTTTLWVVPYNRTHYSRIAAEWVNLELHGGELWRSSASFS